jgi:uncharacterized protein
MDRDPAPIDSWREWCAQRVRALKSRTGNLALVSYLPVPNRLAVLDQIPARIARASTGDGITLVADRSAGVTVDGEPVDGEVFVGRLRADGRPIIECGRYAVDVFSLDGTDYELRVYDADADNLDNFDGVDIYRFAPELRVEGHFQPYPDTGQIPWAFTRPTDSGHTKNVPGIVTVSLDETSYDLLGFVDGTDLVIVFADGTTGAESYPPGRFLRMPLPDGARPVAVDFNRAFIPPCGFSDFYSCPLPPTQNRITAPIRAGEKSVRWKRPRQH